MTLTKTVLDTANGWDAGLAATQGGEPPARDGIERCRLAHRLFTALGEPLFRRAPSDETPVMVVPFGEREATIPLHALRREFAIAAHSPDGRMLDLIGHSLDFVCALRLGDPIPAEATSGEASWGPAPAHVSAATKRLRAQLVAWWDQGGWNDGGPSSAPAEGGDHNRARRRLREATHAAAKTLGTDAREVGRLMDELAGELAHVEALRDWLLDPLKATMDKLRPLGRGWCGDLSRLETLTQVQRLSGLGLGQIGRRFDLVAAHTSDIVPTLRAADTQRGLIRAHRDWLYRTYRAWDPILEAWANSGPLLDERTWALLHHTHHFLAPRFLPVADWKQAVAPKPRPRIEGMVW